MPRRVEDIIRSDHRSIRDIPFTHHPKKESSSAKTREKDDGEEMAIHRVKDPLRHIPVMPPPLRHKEENKNRFKWLAVTLGIFVIIALGGYFASIFYSKASFSIIPKIISISANESKVYTARFVDKTGKNTPSTYDFIYDFITVRATASSTAVAVNGIQTNTKSTGKVTIYNNYSATPIRLIAGTRLTSSNNLLYRLTSSIIVPGYTKTSGTITAGKITTTIIADQAGQNYNISKSSAPADIKITAYKGSVKYDSVYARLSTDIAGGFSGTKKIISPTVMASTTASLKSKLTASLLAQAKSSVKEGYIMYDNGFVTTFDAPVIGEGKIGSATITEQGTLYGIVLQKNSFIDTLADNKVTSIFGDFAYTTPGLGSLSLTFNNLKDFSPDKKDSLIMHVKGNLKLIGSVPVNEIKTKLAGTSLSNMQDIFHSYNKVIESGTGQVQPPWSKIPKDTSKIKITVEE